MTTSRSIASPSSAAPRALVWVLAAVAALAVLMRPGVAEAARKRLVLLEFTGPKADQFRDGVEKALKKSHTLVPLRKWKGTAADLRAKRFNERDVKKVARKLSVDGVIAGKVVKRGKRYLVTLTLREGATGKTVVAPELVERKPKLGTDGKATIKEELLPAIAELSGPGPADDTENGEQVAADRPRMGKPNGKNAPPAAAAAVDEPVEEPAGDRVAAADERPAGAVEDTGVAGQVDVAPAADPRVFPLELTAGVSTSARRLSFNHDLTSNKPKGYDSLPGVAGVYVGVELFPLAFNRRSTSFTRNFGVQLVFDRAIKINSNVESNNMVYALPTTQQHLAAGLVYRHLVGDSLVLDASVRYNQRTFTIDRSNPAVAPADIDVPDVAYTYLDPGVGLGYLIGRKLMVGAGARFLAVLDTGQMQDRAQYGTARVLGLDVEGGADYYIMRHVAVRAALRLATFGYTFTGTGDLTTIRDGDSDQDVAGARDTYLGGFVSGVYQF